MGTNLETVPEVLWGGSLPASTLTTQAAPCGRAFKSLNQRLEVPAGPPQERRVPLTSGVSMLVQTQRTHENPWAIGALRRLRRKGGYRPSCVVQKDLAFYNHPSTGEALTFGHTR